MDTEELKKLELIDLDSYSIDDFEKAIDYFMLEIENDSDNLYRLDAKQINTILIKILRYIVEKEKNRKFWFLMFAIGWKRTFNNNSEYSKNN